MIYSSWITAQELQDDSLSLLLLYISRDNLKNNSGPNICGRNLVSNQSCESGVIQAGKRFSLSIYELCQDNIF